jgi:Tfp pilus assembly protein PilN
MRAVNLLPGDATEGRKTPALPVLVGCGGTVLVTLFLAFTFLSASKTVGARKQALSDAQATLASIPQPAAPPAIVAQLPQQKADRVTALASVLGQRIAFDRILREVSQIVPSDVWLQSLTASVPTAAAPGAAPGTPTGFQISGYTYSQDAVARFLARLEVVPDLTEVTLGSAQGTKLAGRGVVQFTISANIKAPGATS